MTCANERQVSVTHGITLNSFIFLLDCCGKWEEPLPRSRLIWTALGRAFIKKQVNVDCPGKSIYLEVGLLVRL
jgi:hypothetical protein